MSPAVGGGAPELVGEPEFRRLLLAGTPFIDVRAEVEFARGSIPGAVNLPDRKSVV